MSGRLFKGPGPRNLGRDAGVDGRGTGHAPLGPGEFEIGPRLSRRALRSGSKLNGADPLNSRTRSAYFSHPSGLLSRAENHNVIQTLPPHRSEGSLTDGIQIGTARRDLHDRDARPLGLSPDK